MKRLFVSLVTVLFLAAPALARENPSLISQADELFAGREVLSNCEKSVALYEKVLEVDPQNYEAAWKIARSLKFLGDKYPTGDERIEILKKGEELAKKAVEINPQGVDGHFWLGVCLGRIGEERGVLNSLFMVGPIKDEMEAVLKTEPQHDGAHHVLGVLYRKAPGWPLSSGDINKAEEHALLAVKYGPNRTLNHLGLAEVYIARDKNKEAKEELLIVINLPLEPDRIPEDTNDKARGEELLKQVNEKLAEQ